MKKLLLIIVCLFSLSVSAQLYYPMLDSVNIWSYVPNEIAIIQFQEQHTPCSYPFLPNYGLNNQMYTTTDTIINSIPYKILMAEGASSLCVYGYVREDTTGRKIYFQDVLGNPEMLLYNFSMNIGDTISINFNQNQNYYSSGVYSLDSITNRTIQAGVRRAFYLSCHPCGSWYPLIWVESVGNLFDLIYPYSTNTSGGNSFCNFSSPAFDHFVSCFDHSTKVYYDSCARAEAAQSSCYAYFDTCNYFNICGGINELSSSRFYISPNPAHDNFTITSNFELPTSNLEIYNMFGQKVYSEIVNRKQQAVNCKLNAGVYFVRLADDQKEFVQKLIIE